MNGRGSKKKRIEGPFIALPLTVLDSPGFRTLSNASIRVLLMVARQYNGSNNGRLLATPKQLAFYGCNSHDTIAKARRELVEHGLLFQTRQGGRPNRASWYALSWQNLDRHPDYDPGTAEAFVGQRRAYERYLPERKIDCLIPTIGTKRVPTVPATGLNPAAPIPLIGTMKRRA
ncbi:MAG: hypothetical protein ACOYNQ_03835 [Burkholderiales bacterium]|jgi:hypothetical protein